VNRACPSRNLQRMCLSTSSLHASFFSIWRHFHSLWVNFKYRS
jgi:hypothetical protein